MVWRPHKAEILQIKLLMDVADKNKNERRNLLRGLNFYPDTSLRRYYYAIIDLFFLFDTHWYIILFPLVCLSLGVLLNPNFGILIFYTGAFLAAYVRWIKTQKSSNVKNAMDRKDKTNEMIIEYPSLLVPFIGNVFDSESNFSMIGVDESDRTIIKMYIFSEIDNLEFVFEKSRSDLIDDDYTVRAIKIFVARAENEGFFKTAKQLIVNGRYNKKFRTAALKLLFVGYSNRKKSLTY